MFLRQAKLLELESYFSSVLSIVPPRASATEDGEKYNKYYVQKRKQPNKADIKNAAKKARKLRVLCILF